MAPRSSVAGLCGLVLLQLSFCTPRPVVPYEYCSIFLNRTQTECRPFETKFLDVPAQTPVSLAADVRILEDAFAALAVLQNEYFDVTRNTWPSAIDWTAAVIETVVSGMLRTLTVSLDFEAASNISNWKAKENLISSLYDQVVSYYSGQDVVAIMDEAFDDMLWVVLGWIEAASFVRQHEDLHFPESRDNKKGFPLDIKTALRSLPWRGQSWVPSFDSRAQTFWNLGAVGWDTSLCHGGMIWNPRLEPYKNAITNELYISASISLYQYLENTSDRSNDPVYLQAAIDGYRWLIDSNMINSQGLFTDGFHISKKKHGNVECDVRNEMVYTYNQGVILTGQRELWTVTGSPSYLIDGHRLIESVIKATGWSMVTNTPMDKLNTDKPPDRLPPWRGLGRAGILEEECDASGTCSQDAQTFKGIYFHHVTAFCRPLDLDDVERYTVDVGDFEAVKIAHAVACQAYLGWIRHNALAALKTRDARGRFGMWWGAGLFGNVLVSPHEDRIDHAAANTTDYRNQGTPKDDVWGRSERWPPDTGGRAKRAPFLTPSSPRQQSGTDDVTMAKDTTSTIHSGRPRGDPNERGRGRTVETQAGGVALLRAYWEILTQSTAF